MQISQFEQAKENSFAGGRRLHYFASPNVFFVCFIPQLFNRKACLEKLTVSSPRCCRSLPYLAQSNLSASRTSGDTKHTLLHKGQSCYSCCLKCASISPKIKLFPSRD